MAEQGDGLDRRQPGTQSLGAAASLRQRGRRRTTPDELAENVVVDRQQGQHRLKVVVGRDRGDRGARRERARGGPARPGRLLEPDLRSVRGIIDTAVAAAVVGTNSVVSVVRAALGAHHRRR